MDRIGEYYILSHFAEIDSSNNIVQRVLVVADDQEQRGAEFLSADLGLGGTWIQCSYNNRMRKQYPSIGYTYDPVADVFVAPQPFPSWSLDVNHDWQAPEIMPTDGGYYIWNEMCKTWIEMDRE